MARSLGFFALLAVLCGVGQPARAAEVNPTLQAQLMLRVLSYDRNLGIRGSDAALPVAVLYREGHSSSELISTHLTSTLLKIDAERPVADRPLLVKTIAFTNGPALRKALADDSIGAAYLCPGLHRDLDTITAITADLDVLTFASDRADVDASVSIGLIVTSGIVRIVVNLPSARDEGASLDAALLGIAEVHR